MSEFCTGVQILLQRMETHPEEFYIEIEPNKVPRNPKWGHLMANVVSLKQGGDIRGEAIFFSDEELDALYEGYKKIRRKSFDDYIMSRVLDTGNDDDGIELTSATHDLVAKHQARLQLQNQAVMNQRMRMQSGATAETTVGMANTLSNYPYGQLGATTQSDQLSPGVMSQVKKALGL